MNFERRAGILLHPTSLPGPYGIGDLGPEAYRWVDFLAGSQTTLWQVLPLGPTGYGDSPYQCFSAFAGNPYLVSPQRLLEENLLHSDDLVNLPPFPAGKVDYGMVIPWKLGLLDRAWQRFTRLPAGEIHAAFAAFREQHAAWLDDFALFMALKEAHGGAPWPTWEAPLRRRKPEALEAARADLETAIERQAFRQFLFFRQWEALKAYANERGVRIIGDIPIFVAHDSAEVWARPDLFHLDEYGNPAVVAGVPPDYFSETGQLWGNPLYRWEAHAAERYAWWLARIRTVLQLVDIIRLDHFRGFAGYWEIPAGEETAVNGRWVPGPGADFFAAVEQALGSLPLIAEDLGEITPDVVALREQFGLPGMKVLVFAFGDDARNPFLPHNYTPDCVVYTGTHDNDTAAGWYQRAPERERDFARRYLARDGSDIAWDLIRAAWSSVAVFSLAPMQDLLSLDNRARMNYPSRPSGNWQWRMAADALSDGLRARLQEQNILYGRTPATARARIGHLE
ncbi:MAG TPA: 4-alpha-glucanotransferase [Chloroflexi bacterium]|nr:4-alpha-glucanotransferase [Chloroflexota bacterium]